MRAPASTKPRAAETKKGTKNASASGWGPFTATATPADAPSALSKVIPSTTSLAARVGISDARPAAIADHNIPTEERRRKTRSAAKPMVSGVYPNTVFLSGKFASVGADKPVTCIVRLERDAGQSWQPR